MIIMLIANTRVCLRVYVYIVVVVVTKREAQTGRLKLWTAIFVVGKFVFYFSFLDYLFFLCET